MMKKYCPDPARYYRRDPVLQKWKYNDIYMLLTYSRIVDLPVWTKTSERANLVGDNSLGLDGVDQRLRRLSRLSYREPLNTGRVEGWYPLRMELRSGELKPNTTLRNGFRWRYMKTLQSTEVTESCYNDDTK
ncbi:unnamed protein product [Clonostachys byssicola]|uniref:Uncharacterized protein n=1 Tax=Clonostachys byssicola TaxID=160290 RepID=A0A9N9UIE2_9HYPO|nr:unnamed protein product [Clonostachys byssicola]